MIFVAASGTGGHLWPAVHIARAMPEFEICFIGAGKGLEADIIDRSGFRREVIPVVGVQNRGLKGLLEFIVRAPRCLWLTWHLISKLKPKVIIGVGGYVSFFPVFLGWLRGIPTIIHECEQHPGLANKVLAKFATKITTAYEVSEFSGSGKMIVTGQPVKKEIVDLALNLNLPDTPTKLLIVGGSQGARALDLAMIEIAPALKVLGIEEVWHQCRSENLEKLNEAYLNAKIEARLDVFVHKLEEAYAWSDLVISRAGAGAVSELGTLGIPCILVPFPYAQGQHQLFNAKTLETRGLAIICNEGDRFNEDLVTSLKDFVRYEKYTHAKALNKYSEKTDAAKNIAGVVQALLT